MKLPKRPSNHITETEAWKILQKDVPSHWILREISKRDYGIDCYIELAKKGYEVTGDMLLAQLKGVNSISWRLGPNGEYEYRHGGIKVETVNYWMSLPVPVFLFVVDIHEEVTYFVPVEFQTRRQVFKLHKQKSLSFKLRKELNLKEKTGMIMFLCLYFMELYRRDFTYKIRDLFIHFDQYMDFIRSNQALDCALVVGPNDDLMFRHIFETLEFMSKYFLIKWELGSMEDIHAKDWEMWRDPCRFAIHNQTLTDVLPLIEKMMLKVINLAAELITVGEKEWWLIHHAGLFEIANHLNNHDKKINKVGSC